MKFILCALSIAAVAISSAQHYTMGFDEIEGANYVAGSSVPAVSRLRDQYLSDFGIRFSSSAGYAAFVNLDLWPHGIAATSRPNGISATTPGGLVNYDAANPITVEFFFPGNDSLMATTNYFSIRMDRGTGPGGPLSMRAYGLLGNLIVAQNWTEGSGTTMLFDYPGMHKIVIVGNGETALDDMTFDLVAVPFEVTAFQVVEGFKLSGNLASLAEVDNNFLVMFTDAETLASTVEFVGTSPVLSPTVLAYIYTSSVGRFGLVEVVSFQKVSNGKWVEVGGRIAPTTATSNRIAITNAPAQYIAANGEVRTRTRWLPLNDEDPSQDGWVMGIDRAFWAVR